MSAGFGFSDEVLRRALLAIYSKDFHPATEIEVNLFGEIWSKMNEAAWKGFSQSKTTDPDGDFRDAILRNNAVFSAFKVHRMQNDMARLLLDSNGDLKPFGQWKKEVMPIASHQVGAWLRTEYDTAVLRAHQAADWRQFEREKDILPNLRWMPSTSVHPGADHKRFWGTVRPIDDPFWGEHRPGDRWNCKCGLTSTDDPVTPVPDGDPKDRPQPGLENNPGKDGKLFSDKHPYRQNAHKGAEKAVDKLMERIDEMVAEMPDNLTAEEKMAIARNNLEIEKALKITKGKPMSVDKADKQNANPKHVMEYIPDPKGNFVDRSGRKYRHNKEYDKQRDEPYDNNCQTCAPAYALRLRGFDLSAKGRTPGSQLDYLSRGHAFEVWNNIDGTPAKHLSMNDWMAGKGYKKMTPKHYREFFEEACKDEGVYELSIGWKTRSGHATILQRFADGELRYIEPQEDNSKGSGMEWKDVDYLCGNGAAQVHECRGIMRIDNKLFNLKFISIFDVKAKKVKNG